jgi:hypothetical protein
MPIQAGHVDGYAPGPADAVHRDTDTAETMQDDGNDLLHEDEHLGGAGVGIIDGSGETLDDPVVLWDIIMKNHAIIEEVERSSLRAENVATSSGTKADADASAQAKNMLKQSRLLWRHFGNFLPRKLELSSRSLKIRTLAQRRAFLK